MGDSIQLLRYRKSDREEVLSFVRKVYSTAESRRLIQQWDWKYDANPFNRHAEPYILLLKDGARIIGMMGAVPLRVSVGRRELWIVNGCDLIVDPDYRGRGLSRQIAEQRRADNPIGFVWANEISRRTITSLGERHSARLDLLVKPLDVGPLVQSVTKNRWLARGSNLLSDGVGHLTSLFQQHAKSAGLTITEATAFDERVDGLWRRVSADFPVMVVRDQVYLNWRFVSRPDAKYTLLQARRDADLLGYLVLRFAEHNGIRWGYLVDFLVEGGSSSVWAILVEEAEEHLRRERAALIVCLAHAPSYRRTLHRHGFFPWRWGRRGYFHPYVVLPDPTLKVFQEARHWFLTMGDGDLEMSF